MASHLPLYISGVAGIIAAVVSRRFPMSGKAALVLLLGPASGYFLYYLFC